MAEEIKLEFKQTVDLPNLETNDLPAVVPGEPAPQPEIEEAYLESVNLTEEEKQMVSEFAKQIDLNDSAAVLVYGAGAQKKVAEFSDTALQGVKTKDLGAAGDVLATLVTELKGFRINAEEPKGIAKLFKKAANRATEMKARYDKAEKNVDSIVGVLQDHQNRLTTDVVMLDKMYDTNLVNLKELTMYILAGKERLQTERSTTLVELKQKAEETGLAEDAQAAKDFEDLCNRFEKKIYDLELTRTISIQMAPQIRMIQSNDTLMTEKIQTTVVNTIPLWKNQMVLALSMEHSQEAMKAQKAVTDLTNDLISKNAETLKEGSIQIAQESERGIVDLETVQKANTSLIETLDEIIRIQEEGREKRRLAETELGKMEAQLKQKLLDIRTGVYTTDTMAGKITGPADEPAEAVTE